jgi:glycosyltransferase involved in cell wall biosynthesis
MKSDGNAKRSSSYRDPDYRLQSSLRSEADMTDVKLIPNTAISIIIPVLNEEKVIGRCLESLVRQSLPDALFEVILVDNGSTDGTLAVACQFEKMLTLTILRKTGVHISALRNLGAASAKGEFLAFLDADCLAPPQWLSRAVDLLRSDDSMVTGAHYAIPDDSSWVAKSWYQDQHALKHGPVSYVPSGDLVLSHNVFFRVGGFDESIETNEDSEFCHRAAGTGIRVLAQPSLSVVHLGTPQTVKAFYRKHRWQGTAVQKVFWRDTLHSGNLKSMLYALYTVFCLVATVITVPVALLRVNYAALLVPPSFLIVGSFLLAVRASTRRKRWAILIPLTILFLIYGLARAVCLLGVRSTRAARPTSQSMFDSALAENPIEGAK